MRSRPLNVKEAPKALLGRFLRRDTISAKVSTLGVLLVCNISTSCIFED